jgi:hypothetical protein
MRALEPLTRPSCEFPFRLEQTGRGERFIRHSVEFPSPAHTTDASDRVTGSYYEAVRSPAVKGPAAVIAHHLAGGVEAEEFLATFLAQHGVSAIVVTLPGYGARRANGDPGGALGREDPLDELRALQQGVLDLRRAAYFLRARPEVDPSRVGVVGVSLGAFLWSVALFRIASHVPTLEHAGWFRTANSLVLASLSTMLISITGGALSPLFWVYAVLIVAEARQSWWRAAATAWLSWIMLCGLVAMQVSGKIPDTFTGIVWHVYPFQPGWLAHALGIEIWYFAIAIGLTGTARWMDEHERVMHRREDVLEVRERAIAAEHAALQTARQELGRRIFEFDQTKRRFEAERLRWDDERRREAALEGALPGPDAPHI